MKKYIAALLTALLLLCTALSAGAVGPALTTTEAYCIIDADTGLVLAQQNMNEELHPASITKVMTLGLACQKAQGNWDGVKLTVSHEDVYSLAGTDSSHIALREGEEVPLQDALYGTMIASANDGANLLAEYFGGGTLGKVTVTDPGVRLLLADGVTAGDVSASLELPERYVLGTSPEVYAVYTVNGGDKQESTSVRVPAVLTGLDALLEANAGRELDTASDVKPARTAGMLIAISLICTVAAAGATLCVMRVMRLRKTKKQKPSQH